jgi:hypothetical protein
MNLKAIFTTILVVCSITLLNAQSKDILAKSAMLNADEAYGNGQYFECLGFLNDVVTNLGVTNSRIQYLKVKSLMAMGTNDQFNKTIWSQAETELKSFFEVTPENGYVPEKYDEMLLTVGKLKKYIEEAEAVEEMEKIYSSPWNNDSKQKWMVAFQNYLSHFPNGTYAKTARENMDKIISFERMKSNPDSTLGIALNKMKLLDVKKSIENGANPNKFYPVSDPDSPFKFFLALTRFATVQNFKDNYAFLTFLFEHGADPNVYWQNNGCRDYPISDYLQYCIDESIDCNQQMIEIIKLFLKFGFKKENFSNGYYNVLYVLQDNYKNNWSVIEFLLASGADPYKGLEYCLPRTRSPIEGARSSGRTPKYDLIELYKKYKK